MFIKIFSQSTATIISQWLIIKIIITALGLEAAGDYFYYLSISAPAFMLFGANFKNYATQNNYGSWGKLFKNRLKSFSIIILLAVSYFVSDMSVLFVLVIVIKSFEFFLDTVQSVEIRFNSVFFSYIISSLFLIVTIVCWLIISYQEKNVYEIFSTLILLAVLFSLLLLGRCIYFVKQEDKNTNKIVSFIDIAKFVGLPAFIISISAAIPRVVVEYSIGAEYVAVFGAFIYFYLIANILSISLFQSRIKSFNNQNILRKLKHIVLILAVMASIGCGIILIFGDVIVRLLFSEALVEHIAWLPWFIGFISIGSFATIYEQGLILVGKNSIVLKINTILLCLGVVLCPILVAYFGFSGVIGYMYIFNLVKIFYLLNYYSLNGDNISNSVS